MLVEWAQKIGQNGRDMCVTSTGDELFLPFRARGHQRNNTMSTNPLGRHNMLACTVETGLYPDRQSHIQGTSESTLYSTSVGNQIALHRPFINQLYR